MISKISFSEKEIPYEKMEKYLGLSKKAVTNMPKPMLEKMLSGALTPLIELKFKNDEGRELNVPVKLRLERQPNGTVEPRVYPVSDHIARPKGLEIKDSEMERLKRGEVVNKSIREIGDDGAMHTKSMYVQLDRETNQLLSQKTKAVEIPNAIQGVELGLEQKKALLEGKPIQIEVGDQKITAGVDLKSPIGFNIMKGDMMDWQRQNEIKWDISNPGAAQYWMTDQNRWELKQSIPEKYIPALERGQLRMQEQAREQRQERSGGRHR